MTFFGPDIRNGLPIGLGSTAGFGRRAFTPAVLFAQGEQGAWYDPSDLGVLFQDSAGTTPVTAVEQAVGLILDKSGRGNHAIQPGATNRPILRSRYNLLTYSEQINVSPWAGAGAGTTVNADAYTAPNGTSTADEVVASGVNASRYQYITLISSVYEVNFWVRAGTSTTMRVGLYNVSVVAFYNASGSILSGSGSIVGTSLLTVSGLDSNWTQVRITTSSSATAGSAQLFFYPGPTPQTAGYSVGIWGVDVRQANDTYLPYQRIAAATDYDPVGFPVYLAFDGSDDSLYTSSIDFSATDRMTVFAGVTRLSDATVQIIAELSAEESSNNGSFQLGRDLSASGNYSPFVRGTARNGRNYTTYTPPVTNALSMSLTTAAADSAAAISFRVDGVVNAGTDYLSNASTGNFGNYPLFIGRRNNASLPFNGRLYSLVVRGAQTSAALIQQAERWIASKQGRAL